MDQNALVNELVAAVKSNQALPQNPDALAKLQSKVQALAHPMPTDPLPVPDNRQSVSGKVYLLEDNPLQWKSVRLDTGAQGATLTLDAEGRQLKLPIGLDGVYQVSTDGLPVNSLSPFCRMRGDIPLAAQGSWNAHWFRLELADLLGYDSWTALFKFSGNDNHQLKIDVTYNLSICTGNVTLNGTAQ